MKNIAFKSVWFVSLCCVNSETIYRIVWAIATQFKEYTVLTLWKMLLGVYLENFPRGYKLMLIFLMKNLVKS